MFDFGFMVGLERIRGRRRINDVLCYFDECIMVLKNFTIEERKKGEKRAT